MATPVLLAKVKMQIEKSPLIKDLTAANEEAISKATAFTERGIINSLNTQINNLDKMIRDSESIDLIKKATEKKEMLEERRGAFQKGEDPDAKAPPFLESMFTKISGGLKGLLAVGGKAIAILAIVGAAMAVVQPVFRILESIGKMIAEFVRPISDVMVMLVQPLLVMVRPLIQVFRTLMMPFRQLATQGMAMAQRLISEGMAMGGEEGRALVGEGFRGAVSSASLMLSGFMDVILSPLYNIEQWGIGEAIENSVKKWQSSAIQGVTRVMVLADTFQGLIPIMDDAKDAAGKALSMIELQMKLLENTIDDWSIENAETILNKAKMIAEGAIGSIGASLATDEDSFVNKMLEVKEAADLTGLSVEGLAGAFAEASGVFEQLASNVNDNTARMIFGAGQSLAKLSSLQDDLETTQKGFFGRLWEGTKASFSGFFTAKASDVWDDFTLLEKVFDVKSLGIFGRVTQAIDEVGKASEERRIKIKQIEEQATKELEILHDEGLRNVLMSHDRGLLHMLESMNEYFGNSLIPDAFSKGLVHTLDLTNQYMSPTGKISLSFDTGFKAINDSASEFVKGMKNIANDITAIAKQAANDAARARASAARADTETRRISTIRSRM